MTGDCEHRNFLLWDCAEGWIVNNGEDYTKDVKFERKARQVLQELNLTVLESSRAYSFKCHWKVRAGGPWLCTCDGYQLNSRGKSFHPYANDYSGSVSEDYTVTRRTPKYADIANGLIAYTEETRSVKFSAGSTRPVGLTEMMGPGDKWMTCYVGDMLAFMGVKITTSRQVSEFVRTSSGTIQVSTGALETTTQTVNLMLGKTANWVGVQVGDQIYKQVQFKDFYNWQVEDLDNYYSGFWAKNIMDFDDPSLRNKFIARADIKPVDGARTKLTISPAVDTAPTGSWAVDRDGRIFISQMSEVNGKPFNYLTGNNIDTLITVPSGSTVIPIPEERAFYPIAAI